jgi:AcrR family transcriptional regulator
MVPPRYRERDGFETVFRYDSAVARPKLHDEALRIRLLDRAAQLLSDEGPDALSLRRLADDIGTSTTAVYSLFGGKPGLLQAIYEEAFRRFGSHIGAVVPSDDPADDLRRLGHAYRRSALADPHMYTVMFGRRVPGFEPDPQSAARARETFTPLVEAVRRGMVAGLLAKDAPVAVATACWATAHGLVALELCGLLPAEVADPAAQFDATLRAVVSGWQPAEPTKSA